MKQTQRTRHHQQHTPSHQERQQKIQKPDKKLHHQKQQERLTSELMEGLLIKQDAVPTSVLTTSE